MPAEGDTGDAFEAAAADVDDGPAADRALLRGEADDRRPCPGVPATPGEPPASAETAATNAIAVSAATVAVARTARPAVPVR